MIKNLNNRINNVLFITGYSPFLKDKINTNKVFLSKRICSWSQATWRDVWLKFKNHEYDSKKIVQSYKNKFLLSKTGIDLVGMVFQDYQKKINSFAVRTMWFLVKSKGYCLYPINNLVDYQGFDSLGTNHCEKDNRKIKKKIIVEKEILKTLDGISYNELIDKKNIDSYNSEKFINYIILIMPYFFIPILQKFNKFKKIIF